MDKTIKRHIEGDSFANAIYELSETEKDSIAEIKELLKEDHGFFDIVVDLSDYDRMQDMINSLPDDDFKAIRLNRIAEQYLMFKIIKAANIDFDSEYSLEECEEKLFSNSIDELLKVDIPIGFYFVEEEIKEKAKETTTGKARIHFFFDEVNDINLQRNLNELYIYRTGIMMMGYKTKNLLTYRNTNNFPMQSPHDFMVFESEKKELEVKEKIEEKIKKIGGII